SALTIARRTRSWIKRSAPALSPRPVSPRKACPPRSERPASPEDICCFADFACLRSAMVVPRDLEAVHHVQQAEPGSHAHIAERVRIRREEEADQREGADQHEREPHRAHGADRM